MHTPGGAVVWVEGTVDRVDVMESSGRRYIRVVDYKSGGRDFRLGDVLSGLNLQMLLYLFSIEKNGVGALADAIPAGVLYMPARDGFISASRDESVQAQRARRLRMDGLLLDDPEVLRGMEREMAGVFIPVKQNKAGKADPRSALATREELGKLAGKVEQIICDMADALRDGNIPAKPVSGLDYSVCEYCDYRAVCGFEQGDKVREIARIDREAFFRELEENINEGGYKDE